MTGSELIAQERADQLDKHKVTVEQDAEFNNRDQLIAREVAASPLKPKEDRKQMKYRARQFRKL
jgi:hypothetical protein